MSRVVDPFQGRLPDERPLWRLVNGERRAQAIACEVTGIGIELVITVDGELTGLGGGTRQIIAAEPVACSTAI